MGNTMDIEKMLRQEVGRLLGDARFSETDGGLRLDSVPLIAMDAVERLLRPMLMRVTVLRDGETDFDILIDKY